MTLQHAPSPGATHFSAAGRPLSRFAAYAIAALLLVLGILSALIVLPPALTTGLHVTWGMDFRAYLEHAERWLAGGGFYLPEQLAGPYIVEDNTGAVYPPVLLYLLVPFVYGLPWLMWWAVPLGIVGAAIVARRPSPWQLVALAAILVYPRTWTVIVLGNPAMWSLAFLAAGMVWKWPSVFVAIKATFAPLALLGVFRIREAGDGPKQGDVLARQGERFVTEDPDVDDGPRPDDSERRLVARNRQVLGKPPAIDRARGGAVGSDVVGRVHAPMVTLDRRWWYAAGVALVLAVPFGLMWLDYVTVLQNTQTSRGLDYVLGEWPIALLLVAGLARPAWWRETREPDLRPE